MTNPFTNNLSIEQSIIFTLKFYQIIERPLTIIELHKFLWRFETTIENLYESLDKLVLQKKLYSQNIEINKESNVFYSLDKEHFGLYKKRSSIRKRLLKRARFASMVIRYVPFTERVYLCNSLSFGSSKQGSDIDFFVVTKKDRLFFCRTFITLAMSLLRLRRHKKKIADHICLSFFTENHNLDLKKIAIRNDIYLVYWIANLKILNSRFFSEIIVDQNRWIFHYLPNLDDKDSEWLIKNKFRIYPFFLSIIEMILNITFIADLIQKISKIYQLKRATKKLKKLSAGAKNIVSSTMLKFHDQDRREEYRDEWLRAIND